MSSNRTIEEIIEEAISLSNGTTMSLQEAVGKLDAEYQHTKENCESNERIMKDD